MRIEKWDNLEPGIYTSTSELGTAVVLLVELTDPAA